MLLGCHLPNPWAMPSWDYLWDFGCENAHVVAMGSYDEGICYDPLEICCAFHVVEIDCGALCVWSSLKDPCALAAQRAQPTLFLQTSSCPAHVLHLQHLQGTYIQQNQILLAPLYNNLWGDRHPAQVRNAQTALGFHLACVPQSRRISTVRG